MKAGIQAIIMKINEEAGLHSGERYEQIKGSIDREIDDELALLTSDSNKQRDVLDKHNKHEHARRLEYQRSRLNRELLLYQQELTDGIFNMAVEKLKSLPDADFQKMFIKAVSGLKGSFTIHLGALSEGKLSAGTIDEASMLNTGLKISISPESIPMKSGFVIRDDRVEYDHLFEDMVEDMKSSHAAAIMKEVFGNSGDWMFI